MVANNWNPNDWQGKRREQVEYSRTVAAITIAATGLLIIIGLLLKLL